ncbi:MAG: hypothetical protein K0Q72_3713 [Armatimonadetes bacterium]|nr:hypothetical protein [Armatimonadota bacterium]
MKGPLNFPWKPALRAAWGEGHSLEAVRLLLEATFEHQLAA